MRLALGIIAALVAGNTVIVAGIVWEEHRQRRRAERLRPTVVDLTAVRASRERRNDNVRPLRGAR